MLTNFIIFQNYIKQTKELLYKTQKVIIHVSTAMKNLRQYVLLITVTSSHTAQYSK
jgi:uncharacterized HAD superfamily protein